MESYEESKVQGKKNVAVSIQLLSAMHLLWKSDTAI